MWAKFGKPRVARRLSFISASKRTFSKDSKKKISTNGPKVPTSADVVIIGGGIIGCSTLYHLAKLGATNVVLLERNKLTSGTTWHTAGLIWRLRPNDTDIQILNHTRHLLKNVLENETGLHPGWINNGGLFIANSKERLDEYKRLMTLGKVFGIESHVLSPSETKKLYPLMNVDDLYGTLYSPGDGTVNPSEFCAALTKSATKAGAQVIEGCPVIGIKVEENDFGVKHVTGVETASGVIKTNCLVNASGVWGPSVGKMAGVHVPLIAMKHAYVLTNTIDGIKNMPNVRDHDLSLYLRLQGDSLCVGGYEPNPIFWEKVEPDFAFGLFELDWEVFGSHVQHGYHRVPVLEKTGIKSTVCGPESFTPDHKPLLGEDLEVRGFFHGCGFNSLGMNAGGGSGRELAKWVIFGRPELDMFAYDIRRFSRKISDSQRWIKERSHEAYVKNYSIVYPHDEPLASRKMRIDPFYQQLLDLGCVYQEREGWERPGWFSPDGPAPTIDYDYYGSYGNKIHEAYAYSDRLKLDYTFDFPAHHKIIERECLGCRQGVAVFNMSYFGKYFLTGPDAQQAADWIFSNDMTKPNGNTVYSCMLNKRGGVEADLTVSPIQAGEAEWEPDFSGRGFYIAAGGGSAQQSWTHIQMTLQDKGFNAKLTDISEQLGLLSIQGPKSRALLQELVDVDLSNDTFPFSSHQIVHIAGHKVRALRLSFVGELGWELHVPKNSCADVFCKLMDVGKKYGLVNAGYRAIDSLSIEKGYRHWHGDIRMDDTPLEGGLAFTCKLKTSTPFLGREALEEQKKRGRIRKRIACFTINQPVCLVGLEAIWRNGTVVGFLRRGEFGYALGKSIGYGYVTNPEKGVVTPEFIKSGEYSIESLGRMYPATVHTKSPFDGDNKRVKGIYDALPIHQ